MAQNMNETITATWDPHGTVPRGKKEVTLPMERVMPGHHEELRLMINHVGRGKCI